MMSFQEIYDRGKELDEIVADGQALWLMAFIGFCILFFGSWGVGAYLGYECVGSVLGIILASTWGYHCAWEADMTFIQGHGWVARWEWVRRPYSWEESG